jgi:hypothetical protein
MGACHLAPSPSPPGVDLAHRSVRREESRGGRNGLWGKKRPRQVGSKLSRGRRVQTGGAEIWRRRCEEVFVNRIKVKDLFTKPSSPALAPRGSSLLAMTKNIFGLQVVVPKIITLQEVVPKCNLSARSGTKSVISSLLPMSCKSLL